MNTVKVRNVELGAGVPKVAVSITARTKDVGGEAELYLDTGSRKMLTVRLSCKHPSSSKF